MTTAAWIGVLTLFAQAATSNDSPILVREAVDHAAKYADRTVTVAGELIASLEVFAIAGDGCEVRLNKANEPFACAVLLRYPQCPPGETCKDPFADLRDAIREMRWGRSDRVALIRVTGKLTLAPKVFVEYVPLPVIPGLPKGEYVVRGLGHMGAFLAELQVTDAREISAEEHRQLIDVSTKR